MYMMPYIHTYIPYMGKTYIEYVCTIVVDSHTYTHAHTYIAWMTDVNT